MRNAFSKDYLVVRGQTYPETALADGNYPASGAYVDVSAYEWVNIIIHLGVLDSTVTFEVRENHLQTAGTLDVIDATYCKHTIAADDDDEFVTFYIETANLSDDHHFLSVVVSDATGNDYADIVYYLGGARAQPVTQTTTLLPAASQHIFAG